MYRTTQSNPAADWFKAVTPNPSATLRLFCFPYAGGGSAIFRGWPRQLPEEVEVVSALLPGREGRFREPPLDRVGDVIDAAAENILPWLDRPFAFFGHSMGALVSFELARRLRRDYGREPEHLFVSGRPAPQLPEEDPPIYDLPEPEFVAELERLNGTPREVLAHAELLGLVVPLLRADFAVCQTYAYLPAPPLGCPITAFGGLQDPDVRRETLEAWREQSRAGCALHMLPGDHFFINRAQADVLRIIARKLQTRAG
jgi:medium-chain acyl-[acyl-carrier-protein] hydrolase